jgi:xylulokinase
VQMLASILGTVLEQRAGGEAGAALGAARLGWMASGASIEQACGEAPAVTRSFAPNPADQELFAQRYGRFRSLYADLRPRFGAV